MRVYRPLRKTAVQVGAWAERAAGGKTPGESWACTAALSWGTGLQGSTTPGSEGQRRMEEGQSERERKKKREGERERERREETDE